MAKTTVRTLTHRQRVYVDAHDLALMLRRNADDFRETEHLVPDARGAVARTLEVLAREIESLED